jgi:ribosomal protein S18 acetylase RimI-like enzyme
MSNPAGASGPGDRAEGDGNRHATGHVIRPALPGEAEALREVVRAAYVHYVARIGKPPGPMLDDYARRIADGQTWVLEDTARIIGVLVLEDQPDALLLDNIAVRPDCQGGGHGRALMAFAEAEALRRGHRQIRLYTHVLMIENQALYRRLGYVETARITEKGFDRVYMQRNLSRFAGEVEVGKHPG